MAHPIRNAAVVWVVLSVSLAATFLTFHSAFEARRQAAEHRLWNRADRVRDLVTRRIKAYEHILLGAKGLFADSLEIGPDAWSGYVGRLDLAADYPGIQALVFVKRVTAAEKPAFLAAMDSLGQAGFSLHPGGEREEYFPNTWVAQREGRAERVYGFDGYQEPVRRGAMEEAWRSGRPSLTGPVRLRVDSGRGDRVGFAIYAPLYRGGAVPPSPEARRAALRGFLTAFFRLQDLMAGLPAGLAEDIAFRLHDGPPEGGNPLYDSGPVPERGRAGNRLEMEIPVAGRRWTLAAWGLPGLDPDEDKRRPWEILAAGLLGSLLLTGITGSLVRTRSRADALAAAMSDQLQVRNGQFRDLARHAEAITRAKGELLADMSRDLRIPLTRMIGCTGRLLGNPGGKLGERDLAYLSRIREDGENLLAQVDSILELAQIEAGRMELEWSEVDLAGLAREAAAQAESRVLGPGVEIAVEAPDPVRPVRADAAKLKEAVLDLLENALKVLERGKVTLRVRAGEEGAPLALDIAASGSQALQDGSGLGVSLSRARVRLMGFDLEVSGGTGTGPVFTIRFPSGPQTSGLQTSPPAALMPRPAARRLAGDAGPGEQPG